MRETHGMSHTRIYKIWSGIKTRCYNSNSSDYRHYGGRGIKMCESWKNSFLQFYSDMAIGYKNDLTIDRIDVNGDYDMSNCKWVTRREQARNMTTNMKFKGKCMSEWYEELGIGRSTVEYRLLNGWSIEDALFAEPDTNNNRHKVFKPVINLDTNKTYKSMKAAAKDFNISQEGLSKHLKGKQKTFAGHKWALLKDFNNL